MFLLRSLLSGSGHSLSCFWWYWQTYKMCIRDRGEAAVHSIMEERSKNGPFLGIFDFVQRVNLNACNKKNMDCLALAGGFDSFPELKREQYFAVNTKGEVDVYKRQAKDS